MAISLEDAAAAVVTRRRVTYCDPAWPNGPRQGGIVIGTSRSSTYVFVKYDGDYGAKATRLEDLEFADG